MRPYVQKIITSKRLFSLALKEYMFPCLLQRKRYTLNDIPLLAVFAICGVTFCVVLYGRLQTMIPVGSSGAAPIILSIVNRVSPIAILSRTNKFTRNRCPNESFRSILSLQDEVSTGVTRTKSPFSAQTPCA